MKYLPHLPDPFVVTACWFLFGFAVTIFILRLILTRQWRKSTPLELGTSRIYADNIDTRSNYIEKKIKDCWEEDKLNEYLGHIANFQKDYHYDYNHKYQAKKLIEAYEQQKTNIYREQLRAEAIIREMERMN